jgi:hypothetical protein
MMSSAGTTVSSLRHFSITNSSAEWLGNAPTTEYGLFVPNLVLGTTIYGVYSNVADATSRWNFYSNGTAPSYFAGAVHTNRAVIRKVTVTNNNANFTITASTLVGAVRTSTPTANIVATLPTGTDIEAVYSNVTSTHGFEWTYINLAAATYTVTVDANTDHTIVGNMVVQPNSSGLFLTRKTSENVWVTYRLS